MRGSSQRKLFAGLCLLLIGQIGCAAFRPVRGVPVASLPAEMKVGDRSNRRTIDLSLLRQLPPPAHLIDTGDVLGIYIEGFVGKSTEAPPVFIPQNNESPPSFGLPHPVREDGTVSLPLVGAVNVRGMTLVQAEERVKQAYFAPRQLLNPDNYRVQVNLQRPRQYRVLVIRQDSQHESMASGLGQVNLGLIKRGTGKVVNLPAYSNDVLNALTATDGLPGLDAENAVYVIRRRGQFTGGTLDPRWPTDLNPCLMMNSAAIKEGAPVIRAQSMDDNGYLHSPNPWGPGRASAIQMTSGSYSPNVEDNMTVAPSRIWPDRTSGSPMAFDQIASDRGGVDPAAYAGPTFDPRSMNGGYNDHRFAPTYGNPTDASGYATPTAAVYHSQHHDPTAMGSVDPAAYAGPTPLDPRSMSGGYNDPRFAQGGYPGNAPTYGGPALPTYPPQYPQPNGPTPAAPANPSVQPSPVYGPNGLPPNSSAMGTQPWSGGAPAWNPPPVPGYGIGPSGPIEQPMLDMGHGAGGALEGRHVVRIPIRLGPGETADIRPEDVVLYDGDIIFIESRETEVFYTAGLLGGGQYTLPRDYDLDILQAMALATSRGNMSSGGTRAIGGVSALNNDVSISPSTAIVLRKLPDGGEVPVKVDLYRARTDLSERIIIQPGDYILLQYTPIEAVAAFFERHLLETALFAVAMQAFNSNGN